MTHRHGVAGLAPVPRQSELTFLYGEPKAILEWIDIGGMRTPICVDLDPALLRQAAPPCPQRFAYTGTTIDPRTERRRATRNG